MLRHTSDSHLGSDRYVTLYRHVVCLQLMALFEARANRNRSSHGTLRVSTKEYRYSGTSGVKKGVDDQHKSTNY